MKGLLRKDCYLMMKYCRVFLLLVFIFTIVGIKNNKVFFALYPIVLSSIIPVNLLSYDEKAHWNSYACTFPYTRKAIVSSKYILTLCVLGASSLLIIFAQVCNMLINHNFQLFGLFSTFAVILSCGLLPPAFMFPFTFKLGSEKGRFAYYTGFVLFFVILAFFQEVTDNLSLRITQMAVPHAPIVIVFLIVFGLYGLSWFLSMKFYQKRDL
ncbi:hypothetical protein JCM37173_20560 [Allocoprococcus similis]